MLPRRLEDRGPVFLDDILKGWLSCPWEKERHSWVEEAHSHPRGTEEGFVTISFS